MVFCWRKRKQRTKYGMSLSSFNHYNPKFGVFLPIKLKREREQPPIQHSQHSNLSRSGRHPEQSEDREYRMVCVCVHAT